MGSSESISSPRGNDWVWLAGVIAVLLALYYATLVSFYNVFSDEGAGQSHAPLLLAVSIYLVYRAWDRGGRRIQFAFSHLAIVAIAVLSVFWLVLGLVFIEAGQQAVLILIFSVTIIALLGLRRGAKYLMPILLLWTVLPVYSPLVPYLQTAAAVTSALVLELIGLTSIREGYLLIIPNGTFEVADACSGLKFQIVGITLALIHTQLLQVPARVTLTYVAIASMLAFISNIIRIVIVVIIGYFYGMEHEYVQDHDFIGWIVFSILFFGFLYLGDRVLRKHERNGREEEVVKTIASTPKQRVFSVIAVLLALSIGPLAHYYLISNRPLAVENQLSALHDLPGWSAQASGLTEWAPIWTKGSTSFEGSFVQDGEAVDLFATAFNRQRQGHEAVNVSHRVYDVEKWSRISRSARVIGISGLDSVEVEETLLRSPGQKQRLVWLWYSTNDRIVSSPMLAKFNNLIGVLSGKPEMAVFVLSKEIRREQSHARETLEQFLKSYLATSKDFPDEQA